MDIQSQKKPLDLTRPTEMEKESMPDEGNDNHSNEPFPEDDLSVPKNSRGTSLMRVTRRDPSAPQTSRHRALWTTDTSGNMKLDNIGSLQGPQCLSRTAEVIEGQPGQARI